MLYTEKQIFFNDRASTFILTPFSSFKKYFPSLKINYFILADIYFNRENYVYIKEFIIFVTSVLKIANDCRAKSQIIGVLAWTKANNFWNWTFRSCRSQRRREKEMLRGRTTPADRVATFTALPLNPWLSPNIPGHQDYPINRYSLEYPSSTVSTNVFL